MDKLTLNNRKIVYAFESPYSTLVVINYMVEMWDMFNSLPFRLAFERMGVQLAFYNPNT